MPSEILTGPPTGPAKPGPRPSGSVTVTPAEGWRGVGAFLGVPRAIYAGDPNWIEPLRLERRRHLSRANPFFAHARVRLWIARRGGVPVGRVSAQIDDLRLAREGPRTGWFGMLEAIDDAEVFAALLAAAESWLRSEGIERVEGPFSLSINDECGTLVEGFDTPPMLLMPHGKAYYDERIREQGYAKATDLLAYRLDTSLSPPDVMDASVRKWSNDSVVIRPLRLDALESEIEVLRDVFNDAWSRNWGFVPFTRPEMGDLAQTLRFLIPSDFVQIAEVDGEVAAMIVLLPNLNEAIRDLRGRLLPFGWLKILRRIRRVETARIVLMGVRQKHQKNALGVALVFRMIEALRAPVAREGIRSVELSWILEDNRPIHHICRRIGARAYKRYRMYEKTLGA